MNGWTDGWMDEWMDGWKEGRKEGRKEGGREEARRTSKCFSNHHKQSYLEPVRKQYINLKKPCGYSDITTLSKVIFNWKSLSSPGCQKVKNKNKNKKQTKKNLCYNSFILISHF